VAPGFAARIVASGLKGPRGIIFDTAGNLLVIEKGKGVTAFTLNDAGGCLTVKSTAVVVQDSSVRAVRVMPIS
jgi:6-phosphogluconolactonase (cycloisomerase 2 family)